MAREHGDSGKFIETVTHSDVRAVFDAVQGPVVLSVDVAEQLECSRETARRKLEELYEHGEFDRRKVARRVIYWRHKNDQVAKTSDSSDENRGSQRFDETLGTVSGTVDNIERLDDEENADLRE
jgi:predicted transcriptional regulator